MICKGTNCDEYNELSKEEKEKLNKFDEKVRIKLQKEGHEYEDLDEFLSSLNVTKKWYNQYLKFSFKEPTVIYKRRPKDCWINSYNQHCLRLMQSNQDISFALNMYFSNFIL